MVLIYYMAEAMKAEKAKVRQARGIEEKDNLIKMGMAMKNGQRPKATGAARAGPSGYQEAEKDKIAKRRLSKREAANTSKIRKDAYKSLLEDTNRSGNHALDLLKKDLEKCNSENEAIRARLVKKVEERNHFKANRGNQKGSEMANPDPNWEFIPDHRPPTINTHQSKRPGKATPKPTN